MNNVSETILKYFKSHSEISEVEVFSKQNYIELNFFNSLSYAKMISDFEMLFKIMFTSEDLQNPIIHTLAGIIKIVENRLLNQG